MHQHARIVFLNPKFKCYVMDSSGVRLDTSKLHPDSSHNGPVSMKIVKE